MTSSPFEPDIPMTAAEDKHHLRFSVVVIHRNGTDRLQDAVDSILAAIDPLRDEVIVVDNHSTDDSLTQFAARHPQLRIISNPCNMGYARACNQGIGASNSEYILLCNNDLRLPANSIEQFAADLRDHPEAGLIGGQLLGGNGALSRSAGPASDLWSELGLASKRRIDYQGEQPIQVGAIVGACMAARRSAILQAGPLDEDFFFYYEEVEWCVRLTRHGWSVMIDPRVRVLHAGGASTRPYFYGSRVEFFRSRLLYWKKTLPLPAVCLLYAWRLPRLLLDVVFYLTATLLTLGLSGKLRHKLMDRGVVLAWLLAGCPRDWGLPDKCPDRILL